MRKTLAIIIVTLLSVILTACSKQVDKQIYQLLEPTEVKEARKAFVPEEIEGHQEYYFQFLDEDSKRVYREMFQGIYNRDEKFYLSIRDEEAIVDIYYAVLADHPEIFWAHNHKQTFTTSYGSAQYCEFTPEYLYSDEEVIKIQNELDGVYKEIEQMIPAGATDYETIKIVYAYLIDLIDYEFSEHDQNIAGALGYKKAVCAGYARAFQYIMERMGIFCIYVDGDSVDSQEGHAWNIVRIDEKYYYVDVTNGDQQQFLQGNATKLEEHKTIVYDYLCPFPWEYETKYISSNKFPIPACTMSDYNFYVINQGCFSSYNSEEIYEYCKMRIDFNAAVVRFKFENDVDYTMAKDDCMNSSYMENVAQYYMSKHGMGHVEYYYGFLDEFKTIYIMF